MCRQLKLSKLSVQSQNGAPAMFVIDPNTKQLFVELIQSPQGQLSGSGDFRLMAELHVKLDNENTTIKRISTTYNTLLARQPLYTSQTWPAR
jgi:hypothetical protein